MALLSGLLLSSSPGSAAPTIGTVSIAPSVIPANSSTTLTVTVQITDASLVPSTVHLIKIDPNGHGAVVAILNDEGKNGDSTAGDHIYTATYTANLVAGQTQLAVSAVFRAAGPLTSAPVSVLALQVPGTFGANAATLAAGGPLTVNNFGSQYSHGGLLPGFGAAEIDVTSVPLPAIALTDFISKELQGSIIGSTKNIQVSGLNCVQVLYTETYTVAISYDNVAVYCPSADLLYKFYLSYYSGDPKQENFKSSFQQLLDGTQLPP